MTVKMACDCCAEVVPMLHRPYGEQSCPACGDGTLWPQPEPENLSGGTEGFRHVDEARLRYVVIPFRRRFRVGKGRKK